MQRHLEDGGRGERVRAGVSMALVGTPNAGKSSLYNLLLQREAAIVTNVPGTTRDVLEASLEVNGYLVRLLDTAGLRDSDDPVEKQARKKMGLFCFSVACQGMARARTAYDQADVRVLVLDWREVPWSALSKELTAAPSLVVLNKADLGDTSAAVLQAKGSYNCPKKRETF